MGRTEGERRELTATQRNNVTDEIRFDGAHPRIAVPTPLLSRGTQLVVRNIKLNLHISN